MDACNVTNAECLPDGFVVQENSGPVTLLENQSNGIKKAKNRYSPNWEKLPPNTFCIIIE
jgi:hypothetical protein